MTAEFAIHTPDNGFRRGRPSVAGSPGPYRFVPWVGLLALISSVSCGARRFEQMTEPVEAFVKEVKSGTRGTARLRYCFSPKVEEQEIADRTRVVAAAMERYGEKVNVEVIGAMGSKAEIRVSFAEEAGAGRSFQVQVEYEENGWRIRRVDVDQLREERSLGDLEHVVP